MLFGAVGPVHDQHGGEEGLRGLDLGAVVEGGSVDVGDLLVEAALAGADFANLGEEVVEVGLVEEGSFFQSLFVEHVAAQGEVAQDADGPLAKLGGAGGIHAETDGDDGVEIVVGGGVAFAVGGSYPEFPDN